MFIIYHSHTEHTNKTRAFEQFIYVWLKRTIKYNISIKMWVDLLLWFVFIMIALSFAG